MPKHQIPWITDEFSNTDLIMFYDKPSEDLESAAAEPEDAELNFNDHMIFPC